MLLNVLCIGDVVGETAISELFKRLPEFKKKNNIGFCIVNGENSYKGNGISRRCAEDLFSIGADVITGGNHSFKYKDSFTLYDDNPQFLRPHNIDFEYGSGYCLVDMGYTYIGVINLMGCVYAKENVKNPFSVVDILIADLRSRGAGPVFLDFHCDATSEKKAMGYYLDGKITAVFGTHTHVATADLTVLPGGTGYITDIGMTGPCVSVLGVNKDIIINRFKNGSQEYFAVADTPIKINGVIFTVDTKTNKTVNVKQILDFES